jgi:Protein of unknown function (DUF3617)
MEFQRRRILKDIGALGLSAPGLLPKLATAAGNADLTSGLPRGVYDTAVLDSLPGKKPPLIKLSYRPPNYGGRCPISSPSSRRTMRSSAAKPSEEREMRTTIVALGVLGTTIALAASLQPLNVKTGLWQMTQTIQWTGLPPQLDAAMAKARTHSYQTCVKPKDLSTNPWADGSDEKCTWTVVSSTGTDMEVRGSSCNMGSEFGMTSEIHGKIHVVDAENGTGSFDILLSGNGQKISGRAAYTGKWIGSRCAAE